MTPAIERMRRYWSSYYGGIDCAEAAAYLDDLDELAEWADADGDPLWVAQLQALGVTPDEWRRWMDAVGGCGEDVAWLVTDGWTPSTARGLLSLVQGGEVVSRLRSDIATLVGAEVRRSDFIRWLSAVSTNDSHVTDPFGQGRWFDLNELVNRCTGVSALLVLLALAAGLSPEEIESSKDLNPAALRVLAALRS